MKRKIILCLCISALLIFGLAGCGEEREDGGVTDTISFQSEEISEESSASGRQNTENSNILIAYFSIPEDVEATDAVAGASIVVRDDEKMGNTEYVAKIIQETVGGDLFRIETVQQYPLDHDPLVDQAAEEQNADARLKLATHIENLDQYDTIILGYPKME